MIDDADTDKINTDSMVQLVSAIGMTDNMNGIIIKLVVAYVRNYVTMPNTYVCYTCSCILFPSS